MMRFLGSVRFTLILLILVAISVVIGTVIEAACDSHARAAMVTYRHPLFYLLLAGFFLNILVSALRRWPFRRGHLPFLLAHLGLLMVITGVASKTIWGVQGVMSLLEGSAKGTILLPNTCALVLESDGRCAQFALQRGRLVADGGLPEVSVELLGYWPHAEQQLNLWFKGDHVVVEGLSPLAIGEERTILLPDEQFWIVSAHQVETIDAAIEQLNGPRIAFLRDADGEEAVVAIGDQGDSHTNTYPRATLNQIVALDSGKGGYGVSASVPYQRLMANREQHVEALAQSLSEDPQTQNLWKQWLLDWQQADTWLYPRARISPVPAQQLLALSDQEMQRAAWVGTLFDQIEPIKQPNALLDYLGVQQWPLLSELQQCTSLEQLRTALTQQMLHLAELLPTTDQPVNDAHCLSVYLRAAGIAPDRKLFEGETLTLYSPLTRHYIPMPPKKRLESNRPAMTVRVTQGTQSEIVTLGYDTSASGLKWPVLGGQYMARFQPKQRQLPYLIRLRDARQKNYPGTGQAQSYESDILLIDHDGKEKESTLAMNRVLSTWRGYRFYLSNIDPPEQVRAQRAQITINHDPFKYLFTYPGAALVSLGSLLLYRKTIRRRS